MLQYAMAYKFGYDDDSMYDFLLEVGDVVTAAQQEVVKKKVKAKVRFGKVIVKIKVTLEDGTKLKFKHVEPIDLIMKLVTVDKEMIAQNKGVQDQVAEMYEQLGSTQKEEVKNKIGFDID